MRTSRSLHSLPPVPRCFGRSGVGLSDDTIAATPMALTTHLRKAQYLRALFRKHRPAAEFTEQGKLIIDQLEQARQWAVVREEYQRLFQPPRAGELEHILRPFGSRLGSSAASDTTIHGRRGSRLKEDWHRTASLRVRFSTTQAIVASAPLTAPRQPSSFGACAIYTA